MSPSAQKALAGLMLRSLGELHGRALSQTSGLETLGVLAMRMLVAAEQVPLQPLITQAIDALDTENLPVSLVAVREGLTTMFDSRDSLERAGITMHTLQ
jgi:hypothetical protein